MLNANSGDLAHDFINWSVPAERMMARVLAGLSLSIVNLQDWVVGSSPTSVPYFNGLAAQWLAVGIVLIVIAAWSIRGLLNLSYAPHMQSAHALANELLSSEN